MTRRHFVFPLLLCALGSAGAGNLAASTCADVCLAGAVSGTATCELRDAASGQWLGAPVGGAGQLHHRARHYLPWLRTWMMPAGGAMSAYFADPSWQRVIAYGGERDSAIWTGAYLAAEALRALTTGAPDAHAQLAKTVRTLHRWWNISGAPGYLARYMAPASSPAPVLDALPADDPEVTRDVLADGVFWHWRGNISRDQYQGVLLGYSLAYQAAPDPELRALIRADVTEFAEQLMKRERHPVRFVIDGRITTQEVELENVIYAHPVAPGDPVTIAIDSSKMEVTSQDLLAFWPDPASYVRQIPGFGWVPTIYSETQALQLGGAFQVALQVTEGVAEYAERRQAIAAYYEGNVNEWLEIARRWKNQNKCGDSYYGLNIGFMPVYNWIRLETDPDRKARLQYEVLGDAMWPAVADHKNVLFAFIYASQMPAGTEVQAIVLDHVAQLAGFPDAPNLARPVDLRSVYPEDPRCPGLSTVAVDVAQRVPATFIWERQPWKLEDPGNPTQLFGGVDYLLAYWLGRYHGFIADDAPDTCLDWHPANPAPAPGALEIPQPGSYQSGIGLLSGWHCSANRLELVIDGARRILAGHGSSRRDTEPVCGDADNGFGYLINYNLLGDGEHTVAAYADGIPFGSATFEVRTLGQEFATGLSGDYALTDFPGPGQTTGLRWQEANQNFVIVALNASRGAERSATANDAPAGVLEIPQPGSYQSGISLISGWLCAAERVEIQRDGRQPSTAVYGTSREDTRDICGDTDNGFGYLMNYNLLGDGEHQILAYADGQLFASASFRVTTLGGEFMTGLTGQFDLDGFPQDGLFTRVAWQEASQGFVIIGVHAQH